MSIFRKLSQYFDTYELDEICPVCNEKITTYKYREVYKPYDGHGGVALHTYCFEKYVSTIESAAKKVYDYQVEEAKKEKEKVWKEAMASPIDPVPSSILYFVRRLKVFLLLVVSLTIGYLFWSLESKAGIGMTILASILWYMELRRANGTEDYIIENYEDPLQ